MKDFKKIAIFLIILTIAVWFSMLFEFGFNYFLAASGNDVSVQYVKNVLSLIHPIFIVITNFYLSILVFRSDWKDYKLFFILTIFFGVFALMLFHLFSTKVDIEGFSPNNDKNKAIGKGMARILGIYIIVLSISTFLNVVYSIAYPSVYQLFTFKVKALGFLTIIISQIFNIGLGILMFNIAKKDGKNSTFWSILGYFQGLLTLIYYFLCIKEDEKTVTIPFSRDIGI